MSKALLIIDMQNDFIKEGGAEPILTEKRSIVIENIETLINHARRNHIPIIFSQDTHMTEAEASARGMKPHCIRGSWGWKVIDELAPTHDDLVIEKGTYSPFEGTSLYEYLDHRSVKEVVVVGVYTNLCVKVTVEDAGKRYKVILVQDGVASDSEEKHNQTLNLLRDTCTIVSTEELLFRGD